MCRTVRSHSTILADLFVKQWVVLILKSQQRSKERLQKYRKDETKRAAKNRRQAEARKKENKNFTLIEEELEEIRKNARERKRLSGANTPVGPAKKRAGQKVKDKNHKKKS